MLVSKIKKVFQVIKDLKDFLAREQNSYLYLLHRQIQHTQYNCPPPSPLSSKIPHKIIVSLTTYRDRIHHVHYVLDSLYHQSLRPDLVRLYLASSEYEVLPKVLDKFMPWLEIVYTDDIGSYKKFIPALKSAKDDEILISLDDDFIYPPHLIASLYNLFLQNQEALIAYCGFKNDKTYFEGVAGGLGILWNPKIFNPQNLPFFFDKKLFFDSFKKNIDDAWICLTCLEKKIEIVCCKDDFFNTRKEFIDLPNGKIEAISFGTLGSKNYISPEEKQQIKDKMKEMIKASL